MIRRKVEDANGGRHDFTALAGMGISIAAVAGGFALDRGKILDLANLHSLVIVVGGTIGAVLIGNPVSTLASALRRCCQTFRKGEDKRRATADRIIRYAALVWRGGGGSIEAETEEMEHGFLRRALLLVVDGLSSHEVRGQLEADIASEEASAEAAARVFEQAGGYAPTIGIIGAVVGLIQVMKQLGNADEVGRGIAVAFVSTLYGVGLANLLLLPLASRIRSRAMAESRLRELILEGVTAMAERLTLHVVRSRLETYVKGGEMPPADRAASAVSAMAARVGSRDNVTRRSA